VTKDKRNSSRLTPNKMRGEGGIRKASWKGIERKKTTEGKGPERNAERLRKRKNKATARGRKSGTVEDTAELREVRVEIKKYEGRKSGKVVQKFRGERTGRNENEAYGN